MHVSLTRRAFFKGQLTELSPAPVRPPWALTEEVFLDTCSQCNKCLGACDEGILVSGAGGFPYVNFKSGECTFCKACVDVCADGALVIDDVEALPWSHVAEINSDCLSQNAITCRVCGDRCDARAISFTLAVGGVANPSVDPSVCTGCGACVHPCPTDSISINSKAEEHSA